MVSSDIVSGTGILVPGWWCSVSPVEACYQVCPRSRTEDSWLATPVTGFKSNRKPLVSTKKERLDTAFCLSISNEGKDNLYLAPQHWTRAARETCAVNDWSSQGSDQGSRWSNQVLTSVMMTLWNHFIYSVQVCIKTICFYHIYLWYCYLQVMGKWKMQKIKCSHFSDE